MFSSNVQPGSLIPGKFPYQENSNKEAFSSLPAPQLKTAELSLHDSLV